MKRSNPKSHSPVMVLLVLLLFGCTLWTLPADAQDNSGVGYHGAAFLRVSPGARQVAMGEAFSAFSDDINVMRYNIGGLGNIRKIMLAANFHNWLDDTQQGSIGLALPNRFGVVGFEFTYFNEGEIINVDSDFNPTGAISNSDNMLINIGYGSFVKIFGYDFGFGGGLKILRQNLVGEFTSTIGMDLGAQLKLKHLSFGASIQNLGLSKVKFADFESPLPETYRAGMAARIPLGTMLGWNLATDASWTIREKMRYFAGTEVIIRDRLGTDVLYLRSGYKFAGVETSPFAAGFGVNIPMQWLGNSRTRLDYAFAPVDAFDANVHRFSLLFTFGVHQDVMGLSARDRADYDDLTRRLREQLEEAERARLAAQEAEARTRELEEEMKRRLARIQQIAAESQGKIEVEPQEGRRILVTMRINFDFDKANIRPEEYGTMGQVGEILNTYPKAQVHLSGHTDWIGPELYNIRLSHRRVDSVMTYLTRKEDVNQDRYYMPVGYGELKPIATNETPEGRFRNRRVEFLLFTFDAKPEMPEGSAVETVEVVDNNTIRIVCNGKVKTTVNELDNPDRLVIDMPNIYVLTDQKGFDLNRGPFIRARIGFHPEERFSRVVLDLKRPIDAKVESRENYVYISLD